jgi:hypothetical protein
MVASLATWQWLDKLRETRGKKIFFLARLSEEALP